MTTIQRGFGRIPTTGAGATGTEPALETQQVGELSPIEQLGKANGKVVDEALKMDARKVAMQGAAPPVPQAPTSSTRDATPEVFEGMAEANIDTPQRKAAFIAQLAHESGGFRYNEEIASGRQYEGRRDLGNTQPGDGERFKGRGFI